MLTVAIDPSTNPSVEELGGIPRADYVVFAESRAKDVEDGEYAVRCALGSFNFEVLYVVEYGAVRRA